MNSLAGNHWTAKLPVPIMTPRFTRHCDLLAPESRSPEIGMDLAFRLPVLNNAHQSRSPRVAAVAPVVPATWRLDGGAALSLRPSSASLLRVTQGRLWTTFDGPHGGTPDDSGDLVLGPGEALRVPAGQRLVMESWSAGAPACFTWQPEG
jgi:hypothetical protein